MCFNLLFPLKQTQLVLTDWNGLTNVLLIGKEMHSILTSFSQAWGKKTSQYFLYRMAKEENSCCCLFLLCASPVLPCCILISSSFTHSLRKCPVLSCPGCEVLKEQPTPPTWDTLHHRYYDRPASQASVKLSSVGMEGVERPKWWGVEGKKKQK